MSRFDKALERAARGAPKGDVTTPFDVMLPEEAPAAEVFEAPWLVKDGPAPVADAVVTPSAPARPASPPLSRGQAAPAARPEPAGVHVHEALSEKVVAAERMSASVAEQYRKLAGSLHHWQLEHGGKVVAVVSAVSSEGKTLTALNLALTLSASYQRRVLLVDCDLRRPMMHEALQMNGHAGIADIAVGTPVEPTPVTTRLSLLPAGRASHDPVAALTSAGVIALLERGRADYDWIVLDTPPAAAVPDAGLLNEQVDGAVLVVAAGRTSFEMVTRAVGVIGRDRILGVVLNGVDPRDMTAADYHEYYSQR